MRKLAITAFSFSAAVFAALYLLPFRALPYLAAALLAVGVVLLLAGRRWLRLFALCALGLAAGCGCFYLHDLQTAVPAHLLDGTTQEIEARILDYPTVYERYCRVTVKIENESLPHLNALVYDESMALSAAEPGDRVRFTAKASSADRKYGEACDVYFARDLYLKLNTKSGAEIEEQRPTAAALPARIHHALTQRIEQLFPSDTAAFMKSLLLGDKSDLYQDEESYLALSRAGNMHALAVSGLHIAFLVGLVQLMLGRGLFGSLVCIPLVWGFVLITGASPSAVRAAVMQTLLLAAPVLRRENDPPTSLAFALGIILLQNPRAAASVSLQLSFAAMAGILCFGEGLHRWLVSCLPAGRPRRLLAGAVAAAASALAVLPFTVPLTAIHFGYVSLISPISAALCYLAISLCFCGGYLACLLSLALWPLGAALAWVTAWLARYVCLVSGLLASIPYAVVYTSFRWCVLWIGGVYLLFLLFRFLPLRRGEKLLIPALLSVLALMVLMNAERLRYERADGYFAALNVGQGQCLCAFSGTQTAVIDCGGLMSLDQAGELAGRFLLSCGRREIDTLIVTHPDEDHANGAVLLMEMLPVRRAVLPAGCGEEDTAIAGLCECAAEKGTALIFLSEDSVLRLGALSIDLTAPLGEGGNDGGLLAALHFGAYDVLVTGDVSQEVERAWLMRALPLDSELLVVGHHGAKDASSEELLRLSGADTAIVSVGYNHYGHPAEETLERLYANGYNVYRTDRDGTIIIRIEDGHGEKEPER